MQQKYPDFSSSHQDHLFRLQKSHHGGGRKSVFKSSFNRMASKCTGNKKTGGDLAQNQNGATSVSAGETNKGNTKSGSVEQKDNSSQPQTSELNRNNVAPNSSSQGTHKIAGAGGFQTKMTGKRGC